ncbi:SIS domain-containing protein [Streptomyces sp. NPDC001380]|uniref:SIS domain-containing protein n=1 Tax=Streptomyces sp. NPDC001380 TaxID=3364566 RepID=UPI0036C2D768
MLDDALLDDPAALERADTGGALLALAGAGARVRNALRRAEESGLGRLRPDGRPRTVLVAGQGSALTAADVLAALGGVTCPVLPLGPAAAAPEEGASTHTGPAGLLDLGWHLPGWVGSLDLVVAVSADGAEPGLCSLVEQAYIRGCSAAVVAPAGSPLAEAAIQARALPLLHSAAAEGPDGERERDREGARGEAAGELPAEDPAALWSLLPPLLALAGRIGVAAVDERSLQAAADRLDEVAVRCRPDAAAYLNPGKSLAGRLSGVLPLLWGDGPLTAAAARRFASLLADRAGQPALTGVLPQVLTGHRGLFSARLGGGTGTDDFFRDRVDEPDPLRLHVLLLRRVAEPVPAEEPGIEGPGPSAAGGAEGGSAPTREDRDAAALHRAVARAQRLAEDHGVVLSELAVAQDDPVGAFAELVGTADFAAVYLGLATGS